MENKIIMAGKRHLENIDKLSKGEKTDYSYLDSCFLCDKKFSLWDKLTFNIQHSFGGNSHRRACE